VVDAVYGRLDGQDEIPIEYDEDGYGLGAAADEDEPITNDTLVKMLEEQLEEALNIIRFQTPIVRAAREFAETISAINHKTGKPVFMTPEDDDLAVELLQHRYSDLASLLNGSGRTVPGKLAQGTVH